MQAVLRLDHVAGRAQERQRHYVREPATTAARSATSLSVRAASPEIGVGKVDALLRAQARTAGRGAIDLDLDAGAVVCANDAAYLAVVQPDAMSEARTVECRGGCNGCARGG